VANERNGRQVDHRIRLRLRKLMLQSRLVIQLPGQCDHFMSARNGTGSEMPASESITPGKEYLQNEVPA
jgi:hypothetical protein